MTACFYVTDGNIGSPTPICDIANKHANDSHFCAGNGVGTWENAGPTRFTDPDCGMAIDLNGSLYYGTRLNSDDNECSAECAGLNGSLQGLVLYTTLPACAR